jgi:hypothetical protein
MQANFQRYASAILLPGKQPRYQLDRSVGGSRGILSTVEERIGALVPIGCECGWVSRHSEHCGGENWSPGTNWM